MGAAHASPTPHPPNPPFPSSREYIPRGGAGRPASPHHPQKIPPKLPILPIDFSDLHSTLMFRLHVYTQTSQQNSVKHRARQIGPPSPLSRGACSRGGWSPHARLPRGCPRSPTAEDFPCPGYLPGHGCLRHCAADESPLHRTRCCSGCPQHCAAEDFPPRRAR